MEEEMLWNGIRLRQTDGQFALCTDSVICADFARFPRHSRVADLGCGNGAISLMLLANDSTLHITGIELQSEAVQQAEENRTINNLNASFTVLQGDLREIKTLLPSGSMDCVVSNPPYFPAGSGFLAEIPAMASARSEGTCSLPQLCAAAAWLLRFGGRFALVHRPERLADLLWNLKQQKLEPKRIRFVRHHPGAPFNLVLTEARKGGKTGLLYEPELILFDANGVETKEYRAMYHRDQED